MDDLKLVQWTIAHIKFDSLIRIYIGSESTPYLIQKSIFDSTFDCHKAFDSTFRDGRDKSRYDLDAARKDVWKLLLYWIVHREPLPFAVSPILQECWMTGRTYSIPAFQDAAMTGLLQHFDKPSICASPSDFLNASFFSRRRSQYQLRELLLEELVKCLYQHDMDPAEFDMYELGDVDCMMLMDLVMTHKRFIKDKDSFFDRFTKRNGKEKARWEDFMVTDGMKLLWARDVTGESILGKRKVSEKD